MRFLDRVLGRRHPSTAWEFQPGLEIKLDLDRHALCNCRIGDPIEWLSGLGPPEDSKALREHRYSYYSTGIEIGEENGTVADFAVSWVDYLHAGFRSFQGPVIYGGRPIPLNSRTTEREFVDFCGRPYFRDQDQDETILFYEFRGDIEWQVEFSLEGSLKAIRVVWPALMAETEHRKRFGVDLPWPPRRE